jgi:hypothetical protein
MDDKHRKARVIMATRATNFGLTRVDRTAIDALVAAERARGAVVLTLTTGAEAERRHSSGPFGKCCSKIRRWAATATCGTR